MARPKKNVTEEAKKTIRLYDEYNDGIRAKYFCDANKFMRFYLYDQLGEDLRTKIRKAHQPEVSLNIITPWIRYMIASLTSRRPAFESIVMNDGQENAATSTDINKAMQHIVEQSRFDKIAPLVMRDALVKGVGIFIARVNPYKKLSADKMGDVVIERVIPDDVFVDKIFLSDWQDADDVIIRRPMLGAQIKALARMWKINEKTVLDEAKEVTQGDYYVDGDSSSDKYNTPIVRTNASTEDEKLYWTFERFHREYYATNKIRINYYYSVGNTMLYEMDDYGTTQQPIGVVTVDHRDNGFPVGLVEGVFEPQENINKLYQIIVLNASQISLPHWFIPESAVPTTVGDITASDAQTKDAFDKWASGFNEAGGYTLTGDNGGDPNASKPWAHVPQPLNPAMIQLLQMQIQMVEKALNVSPLMGGDTGGMSRFDSNKALNTLVDLSTNALTKIRINYEAALMDIGQAALEKFCDYHKSKHIQLVVKGKYNASETLEFNKRVQTPSGETLLNDLASTQVIIRVRGESTAPLFKQQKMEQMMSLHQMGMMPARHILEMSGLENVEEIIKEVGEINQLASQLKDKDARIIDANIRATSANRAAETARQALSIEKTRSDLAPALAQLKEAAKTVQKEGDIQGLNNMIQIFERAMEQLQVLSEQTSQAMKQHEQISGSLGVSPEAEQKAQQGAANQPSPQRMSQNGQ